jgi:hypothetical protein
MLISIATELKLENTGVVKMTTLRIVILIMMFVGSIFILMSNKKRSYLDTQLLSNNARFVIGSFLVIMAIVIGAAAFLKGML